MGGHGEFFAQREWSVPLNNYIGRLTPAGIEVRREMEDSGA
jgi:hypothetical protein